MQTSKDRTHKEPPLNIRISYSLVLLTEKETKDIIRNIKEDTDHGAKTKLSKRFDLYINRKPHCRMWCFIFCIT